MLFLRFQRDGTPQEANANSGTYAVGFAALLDAGFTALLAADTSMLSSTELSSTEIAMLLSVIN